LPIDKRPESTCSWLCCLPATSEVNHPGPKSERRDDAIPAKSREIVKSFNKFMLAGARIESTKITMAPLPKRLSGDKAATNEFIDKFDVR
jgi:hypothetical protein